jgi:hypothetical protein
MAGLFRDYHACSSLKFRLFSVQLLTGFLDGNSSLASRRESNPWQWAATQGCRYKLTITESLIEADYISCRITESCGFSNRKCSFSSLCFRWVQVDRLDFIVDATKGYSDSDKFACFHKLEPQYLSLKRIVGDMRVAQRELFKQLEAQLRESAREGGDAA